MKLYTRVYVIVILFGCLHIFLFLTGVIFGSTGKKFAGYNSHRKFYEQLNGYNTCQNKYELSKECTTEMESWFNCTTCFSGRLLLNGQSVYQWDTKQYCQYIFQINRNCDLQKAFELCGKNMTESRTRLNDLSPDGAVVGAYFGSSLQAMSLMKYLNLNRNDFQKPFTGISTRSHFIFAAVNRHWEHIVWKENDGTPATIRQIFHLGYRFDHKIDDGITYDQLVSQHQNHDRGGGWRPDDCHANWRIALIIPYRDRHQHLMMFLDNILPFLKQQNVDFRIFVIEQSEPELFNRAALLNIGYLLAKQMGDFNCYIFHDVDTIPEDLSNLYACGENPRALALLRNCTDYIVFDEPKKYYYFSGAIALTDAHMQEINGFSNQFYGWGGEDDEMFSRVMISGLGISRYPDEIGAYTCFYHNAETGNPHPESPLSRLFIRAHARLFMRTDGLNSVDYTLLGMQEQQLHTHILVKIPGPTNIIQQNIHVNKMREYVEDAMLRKIN